MQRLFFLSAAVWLGSLASFAQIPAGFKGDLQSELRFTSGQSPVSMATGDVNGDGHVDVVVANSNDGTIGVYLGNGDGTLGMPSFISLPLESFPVAVALADIDGDGKLDIVEADYNIFNLTSGGAIRILLGNGDGTFQSAVSYVAGKNLTSLVVADFNGDGKPDVATVDNTSGSVSVLLNDGTGKLMAPVPYKTGVGSYAIAAADLRKAGKTDLVVSNACAMGGTNPASCQFGQASDNTIAVLLGNGDGTFQAAVPFPAGPTPFKMVLADFNGDGIPDVAVTNNLSQTVSVLLGKGDGTFLPFAPYFAESFPTDIVSADFNGDSKADLMVGSAVGLTELLGNGDGTFASAVNYFVGTAAFSLHVSDLNGDGHPDLVAGTSNNTIGVFLNAFGKTRQTTAVTVSASPNPQFTFQLITLTAAVSSSGGAPLSGSVTFYVNGSSQILRPGSPTLPIGKLDNTGHATAFIPQESLPGAYSIAAIYSGDTLTEGSTSPLVTETVNLQPTRIDVSSSSVNPSSVGQPVTLTATVVAGETPTPSGNVSFFDGSTLLGTAPAGGGDSPGTSVASFTVSNLTAGDHSITVTYSGDASYAPSTSPVFVQHVNGPLTITLNSSSTATINAGFQASWDLTLASGGLNGSATLACSGAPINSSCTITPSTVSLTPFVNLPFTVSVNTQLRGSNAALIPLGSRRPLSISVLTCVGLLLLALLAQRSKGTRRRLALIPATAVVLILAVGCGGGGGSSPSQGMKGTPAGTYTIVITATSGSMTSTQNVTLNVN